MLYNVPALGEVASFGTDYFLLIINFLRNVNVYLLQNSQSCQTLVSGRTNFYLVIFLFLTTSSSNLNWRTFHASITTIYATISFQWSQSCYAIFTFIEKYKLCKWLLIVPNSTPKSRAINLLGLPWCKSCNISRWRWVKQFFGYLVSLVSGEDI